MAARRSGSTARRRSWPRKRNQGIRRDSTCYGGAISSANTANDEWRVCGHGDGTRLRNTARSARGETAYRALLASQRGHGGAVGPRRSYCSGVGGTRCELRPAMATAKVPGTAAAAAVAAVSKGEGKAKSGARRLTGARWVLSWRSVAQRGLSGQDIGDARRPRGVEALKRSGYCSTIQFRQQSARGSLTALFGDALSPNP